MRIHIIGAAGSGKTTVAQWVSQECGVPHSDLDFVSWENGSGGLIPLEKRLADVETIANQPGWVTEGVYLWWIESLVQAADEVVWLDLPPRICLTRIVVRHARKSLAGTNLHPGLGKLYRFVKWQIDSYYRAEPADLALPIDDRKPSRASTEAYLRKFRPKLTHLTTPAQVRQWQANFRIKLSYENNSQ